MNCSDIQEPVLLHDLLNKNDSRIDGSIRECGYKIYFEPFAKFAYKQILHSSVFDAEDKSDLIRYAFAEGQHVFLSKMKNKAFESGEATLKTYFFTICKFQLLAMIEKQRREGKKAITTYSELIEDIPDSLQNDWEIAEEQYELYEKAMMQIDENCRRWIEARKLNKGDPAALAAELGIEKISINNTVFKCKEKLIKIVAEMQKQTDIANGNYYRTV